MHTRFSARNRRFAIGHLLLLMASIDCVILGLMLLKNPPARVYYPLFAFQSLYMLVLMRCDLSWVIGEVKGSSSDQANHESNAVFPRRYFPRAGFAGAPVVLAILGMILGQIVAFRNSTLAVSSNRRLHEDLARIDPRQDELFICWGDRFPYESILPLESPDAWRNLHLYCLGWLQQSPINVAVKKRFGINDLAIAMVKEPDVYVLGSTEAHRVHLNSEFDLFRTFVFEHYQLNVKWGKHFSGDQVQILKAAQVLIEASSEPTATRWR